jgi:4-amino-4-deoxy-L-arabinose transferase-like glycosyltransferase
MRRARLDLAILAALALLANLTYFAFSSGDFFYPDSATYIAPARSMLAGHGFTRDGRTPETFRTPGYPLALMPFIAASPNFAAIVVILQHLLNALLAMAIYLFARQRFSRFVAFAAAAVFAIDPSTIHYANKVLTETLFTLLLFALVWAFAGPPDRGRSANEIASGAPAPSPAAFQLLLGLLCGVLVLIRPLAILYFVVLAVLFAFWRRRGITLFVIASLVLPLAWAARNRARTGVFSIADVAGVNMLLHRAAPALAIFDDYDFAEALHDRQEELSSAADEEIAMRYHVDPAEITPAMHAKYFGRIGRRIALQHPLGLALLHVRGVLVNLFDSDWDAFAILSRVPATLVQLVLVAWTHLVTFLAIFGLIVMRRRDARLAALFALTIAYFIVLSAGSEAESRFRVPVVPLMAIAAACGAERIGGRISAS